MQRIPKSGLALALGTVPGIWSALQRCSLGDLCIYIWPPRTILSTAVIPIWATVTSDPEFRDSCLTGILAFIFAFLGLFSYCAIPLLKTSIVFLLTGRQSLHMVYEALHDLVPHCISDHVSYNSIPPPPPSCTPSRTHLLTVPWIYNPSNSALPLSYRQFAQPAWCAQDSRDLFPCLLQGFTDTLPSLGGLPEYPV